MQAYFDANHWKRVKQARDAQGLNRIPAESLLRPNHRLARATLRHRESGESWTVTAIREDWLVGRFLTATLESNGCTRTCVVETISSENPEVYQQLDSFNDEFEILTH
jgi:hypothetical protein